MAHRCPNKSYQLLIVIITFLFFTTHAHASLINSDFSNGFDGWKGYLEIENFVTGDFAFEDDLDPSTYPSNFSLLPNGIKLTPSEDGDDLAFVVGLYQDFTFGPLAANTRKILSLSSVPFLGDVDANDPDFSDFFDIFLFNETRGETRSLISGGDFDITDWAGDSLILEFFVGDVAGDINSSLALSNITLFDKINEVPEPQVFGLAILAMLLMRIKRT